MSKKYIQPVRGTHDLIGDDMRLFRHIVDTARDIAWRFGFDEMQTPIFEFSDVFHRSLGDTSDVVSKETYTFEDRGGESITLRPEFTAAIVRAFISNGYTQKLPFKAFYSGPAFRYERPQKGRQRQFHQVGVECLGANDPWQDVEAIGCGIAFLSRLFGEEYLKNSIKLEINTLGDEESRANYREALISYLNKYKADLSEESQIRLEKNPLRILDSKQEEDRNIVCDAPVFSDYLTYGAEKDFEQVKHLLTLCDERFVVSPRLVRGLDYYSHTVFEFTTDKLGAQATLLAGGRYNKLVEQLGGPPVAGIGWASGVERIALLLAQEKKLNLKYKKGLFYIGVDSETSAIEMGLEYAATFRRDGFRVEMSVGTNPSKLLKKANAVDATHFVFIGRDEVESTTFNIKDLDSGEVSIVALKEVVRYLQSLKSNINH